MTTYEIIEVVRTKLGEYSLASFHRDRRKFEIKALGARQRPQRYPDNTAEKILYGRGLNEFLSTMRVSVPTTEKPAWVDALQSIPAKPEKLTTITKLRAVRKQGRAKR